MNGLTLLLGLLAVALIAVLSGIAALIAARLFIAGRHPDPTQISAALDRARRRAAATRPDPMTPPAESRTESSKTPQARTSNDPA